MKLKETTIVGTMPYDYDPKYKLTVTQRKMKYNELEALVISWADLEIWKPVKGYEKYYEISNLGRLVSLDYRGNGYRQILKTNINKNGYEQIRLNVNKIGKNKKIHRLVAESFLPNPENKKCVNHKDSNRINNRVDNLEWCTHSENIIHGFKNGFIYRTSGEDSKVSKLNNEKVIKIYISKKSHRELAKEYRVTKSCITSIKSKKTWKKITENL